MMLSEQKTSIYFQERDLAILQSLFESRIMTSAHVAALHFDGNKETVKQRLYKLKAAGLIGNRERQASEYSILFLTTKAFKLLKEEGILAQYPKLDAASLERRTQVRESTLRHELDVLDVKAAFHSAIRQTPQFKIVEFCTWPLLNQFEAFRPGFNGTEVLVKPDGYIRIHEKEADGGLSEHVFYLEVDRSSETQETLVSRAGCYLDYYKSGGFAVKNGAPRSAYKEYPFRVLMVFKSAERRNNTAERLLQINPPIFTQVCLTTTEEVKANPLGAIWIRPFEYREATKGTVFDPAGRPRSWGYKRQTERELLVEKTIKKFSLLEPFSTAGNSL